jgi:chaperone required for assembly of F1-ATPase
MKRFWDKATATGPLPDGGFTVLLDGKPVRLPGGESLRVDHRALAEAIAAEWDMTAAGAEVAPSLFPLTQLAATAGLRIAPAPSVTAVAIAAYARSDLLCYRAEEPPALVQRQHEAWQPWLNWAEERYGATLLVTQGITLIDQNPQALAALSGAVAAHDAHGLAALGVLVPVMGSLILGLAVIEGRLDAGDAFRLSALDEVFQEEHWGQDRDAVAQRSRAEQEVRMAARYFMLTRRVP